MKILYYKQKGQLVPGIVTDKGIVDITRYLTADGQKQYTDEPLTLEDLDVLRGAAKEINEDPQFLLHEKDLEIGPCIPKPPKIICIGLNYRKHALESGMAIPTTPVVFTKYSNTLTDYGRAIPLGLEGEQFDYEVELGVIMGRKCKNVSMEEALSYVLGYCVANDLSCRDLQFKTSQWLLGKSLDHFLPLGKYFVTAEEVGDPQGLQLSCSVNGELRQSSNTSDMIFSVAEIIAFLSRHMTLEPGDLIVTGTPEGVIMGREQKDWLKAGDRVQVEIEGLGNTCNMMV